MQIVEALAEKAREVYQLFKVIILCSSDNIFVYILFIDWVNMGIYTGLHICVKIYNIAWQNILIHVKECLELPCPHLCFIYLDSYRLI